jgi:putative ATPase
MDDPGLLAVLGRYVAPWAGEGSLPPQTVEAFQRMTCLLRPGGLSCVSVTCYDGRMEPLRFGQSHDPPLAERMRPTSLDEVAGQARILGKGRSLRTLIDRGDWRSFLFWGPPGTGKTTVGRILAQRAQARFVHLSAALTGVKEVRATLEGSRERHLTEGRRDILFLDEVHRFTRSQQDVLLPYLEEGSVIFIGATTENPSFSLNAALLSRCQLFCFEPLSEADMQELLRRAAAAPRGLGGRYELKDEACELIVSLCDGDARRALTTLELAASIAPGFHIDRELVEDAVQRKGLRYDRAGEEHYNVISALHKSVRNSDPDAALYWLARMIEAGEDPRFIARRLIRMASEDVGLAEPDALGVAVAAMRAVESMGLPECDLALAQAAVYLACSPKSNALYVGFGEARSDVAERSDEPVPLQLRNAPTQLMKDLGYGRGYQYAHDLREKVARMDCLPSSLLGRCYYRPSSSGHEQDLAIRLERIRQTKEGPIGGESS